MLEDAPNQVSAQKGVRTEFSSPCLPSECGFKDKQQLSCNREGTRGVTMAEWNTQGSQVLEYSVQWGILFQGTKA